MFTLLKFSFLLFLKIFCHCCLITHFYSDLRIQCFFNLIFVISKSFLMLLFFEFIYFSDWNLVLTLTQQRLLNLDIQHNQDYFKHLRTLHHPLLPRYCQLPPILHRHAYLILSQSHFNLFIHNQTTKCVNHPVSLTYFTATIAAVNAHIKSNKERQIRFA